MHSRIINLLVMILFLIHWLGCMHYLVADTTNSYPYPRGEWSWLTQMELWDSPVWEKYAHCVLRALSNMVGWLCKNYWILTLSMASLLRCAGVSWIWIRDAKSSWRRNLHFSLYNDWRNLLCHVHCQHFQHRIEPWRTTKEISRKSKSGRIIYTSLLNSQFST